MLKVMLVDDEPYTLQGLQVIIDWESGGFEIAAVCSNGKEALKYLADNQVDLIISDIKMPEMNGLELLETIKREKISDAALYCSQVTTISSTHREPSETGASITF